MGHEASVGQRIGRYTVLKRLGEGGMGRVYAAYDEPLDRKVAVKVLHPERAHDLDEQQRLWREAQSLARLSHPNVVTVYEVGRSDDAVFIAMEFVRGKTLGAWQAEKPGWREMLQVYREAGAGLAAAHEKGMVHRDFKPQNVIRTEDGAAKVLDFGLAREAVDATTPDAGVGSSPQSRSSALTEPGIIMGTPAYMAPEQQTGGNVDDRSDQYAFCVALWEGLTGSRPFAGTGRRLYEAKLCGPPAWPDDAPAVPGWVVDALRIGLQPDSGDRWESMAELLGALRSESPWRRRRWVLGAAVALLVGFAGVGARAWEQARSERCSGARAKLTGVWDADLGADTKASILSTDLPYAQGVWDRTSAALDRYANRWAVMHVEACAATTIRGEQSELMMDRRMGCLRRGLVELSATVETISRADADVLDKVEALVDRLPSLDRCEDLEALVAEVDPPPADELPKVQQARKQLAHAASESVAGRPTAAKVYIESASGALADVEYGPVLAERALAEGRVLSDLGEYEAAEAVLMEALELGSKNRLWELVSETAAQLMLVVGAELGRCEEGLRYWPLAAGIAAGDSLATARAKSNYAVVLERQGKFVEAEAAFREVLRLREEVLAPDHRLIAVARGRVGEVLGVQGRYDEAEAEHRKALASLRAVFGDAHPAVAAGHNNLAVALDLQGKSVEAEAEFRASLAAWTRAVGPEHPKVLAGRVNLAASLQRQGKLADAEAEYRAAIASMVDQPGRVHSAIAMARNNLGGLLHRQGRLAEAEAQYRGALASWLETLGSSHPTVAKAQSNLAVLLADHHRYDEARVLAESAWAQRQRSDVPVEHRAATAFVLARILWALDRRARARELAEQAVQGYRAAVGDHAAAASAVEAWLRQPDAARSARQH